MYESPSRSRRATLAQSSLRGEWLRGTVEARQGYRVWHRWPVVRGVTGATTTLYVSGPEGPLASSTAGAVRYFTKDLHGDTVGTVNSTGTVTGAKLYSPWGEAAASSGESTILGFQSQPTDADTGYVDMMTRLYDPAGGRFTSRDVLFGDTSAPIGLNQYVYANGSPVTMDDMEGLAAAPTSRATLINPWGCWARVDKPHGSTRNPGQGSINVKGYITSCTSVPYSVTRWIRLTLYQGDWVRGWQRLKEEPFECPQGGSSTNCYSGGNMRGVLSWKCPVDSDHNYAVSAVFHLTKSNGSRYQAQLWRQTGDYAGGAGEIHCNAV